MLPLILAAALLQQLPNASLQTGTVVGMVRTSSGSPAARVRVSAMVPPTTYDDVLRATALASVAETDEQGRYRLENIPPGRYYISAGRIDVPTFYPGTLEIDGARVVVVDAASFTAVDFVLLDQSTGRAPGQQSFSNSFIAPGFQIRLNVRMEGGGKVPVFAEGGFPLLRLTDVRNGKAVESLFSASTIVVPVPAGIVTDDYTVALENIPRGYALKSATYGTTDLLKAPLRVTTQGIQVLPSLSGAGPAATSPSMVIVVLEKTATAAPLGGVRVSGSTVFKSAEVYLSGNPGTLYNDGSFEFLGVAPGLHTIVCTDGDKSVGRSVIVGQRDVDSVALRGLQILPTDAFDIKTTPFNGTTPAGTALDPVTVRGRVLDETSQQPLTEGTITLTGYVRGRAYALDSSGRFEVPDLLPGTYRLNLNVSGFREARTITVGLVDTTLELSAQRQ